MKIPRSAHDVFSMTYSRFSTQPARRLIGIVFEDSTHLGYYRTHNEYETQIGVLGSIWSHAQCTARGRLYARRQIILREAASENGRRRPWRLAAGTFPLQGAMACA